MRRILIPLVAAALALSACGGGGASVSSYCKELKKLSTASRTTTTRNLNDAAAVAATGKKLEDAVDALRAKSPTKALKDDYALIGRYFKLIFAARAANDPAKASTPDALALAKQLPAAQARITKYISDNCKGIVTTPQATTPTTSTTPTTAALASTSSTRHTATTKKATTTTK